LAILALTSEWEKEGTSQTRKRYVLADRYATKAENKPKIKIA